MKTTFSRQFALIAALLLVCMIFTGVSFRFLMLGYLKNDKKETLSADAAAVASLAEAYDSTGELEENWDFRLSLSLFSDVGEAEALVCDENGFEIILSLNYVKNILPAFDNCVFFFFWTQGIEPFLLPVPVIFGIAVIKPDMVQNIMPAVVI